jgi:predicted GIY-YIG superfamily endonuclease
MLKLDTYLSFNLVYVLRLEDDCYYIGVSSNLNARLAQHFCGDGSAWTRRHKPIELIEVHIGGEGKEDEIALQYIKKYGYHKARGGKYLKDKKTTLCYWLKQIKL